MTGDFRIDGGGDPPPGPRGGRHPWWSRVLYALYGIAAGAGGIAAELYGHRQLAIGAGVIALVLVWKAAQRVR